MIPRYLFLRPKTLQLPRPRFGTGQVALLGSGRAVHRTAQREGVVLARAVGQGGIRIGGWEGGGVGVVRSAGVGGVREFHETKRRELPAPAVLVAVAAVLKSTAGVTIATTIARALLTLLPFSIISLKRFSHALNRMISNADPDPCPIATEFYKTHCVGEEYTKVSKCDRGERELVRVQTQAASLASTGIPEELHAGLIDPKPHMWRYLGYFYLPPLSPHAGLELDNLTIEQRIALYRIRMYEAEKRVYEFKVRALGKIVKLLIGIPGLVLALALAFSLERVPYTGRWRTIMLSPQEEDALSSTLSGPGWYTSVLSLLTTPSSPSPPIVPITDWRWEWVNAVMRQLEKGVVEQVEAIRAGRGEEFARELGRRQREERGGGGEELIPAPSRYPLQPRARAASALHASLPGGVAGSGKEHLEFGPPYSLLLLEKDERNAMSYGFGPGGSGGVVVFTGILDEIMSGGEGVRVERVEEVKSGGLLSLFGVSTPPPARSSAAPQPTEEQTLRLAAVLSHELAHLLLSHHLEHVSVADVMIPSVASLIGDLARTLIFPITMVFGPFVNDAIANMSKTWVGNARFCEDGMNATHEVEADIVGLRILSYAGFCPRKAVSSLHSLSSSPCPEQLASSSATPANTEQKVDRLWYHLRGAAHLTQEKRLEMLDGELDRWVEEWRVRGVA